MNGNFYHRQTTPNYEWHKPKIRVGQRGCRRAFRRPVEVISKVEKVANLGVSSGIPS